MTTRDVYAAKMKHQIDELNAKMSELDVKAQTVKAEAQEKYKEEIAKLREQSHAVGSKLDELKAAADDKWESMVAEMDKLRDAFTHSFNYFKSQI